VVSLSWTAPIGNGTTIASYVIRNLTNGTTQSTTATTFLYRPLDNGVAYTFDVQAIGGNGTTSLPGAASPAGVTPVGAPSPPTGLTVRATSPTSATVTFSQQSPSNGTTVGLYAISTVPATTTVNATTGDATLTGLTPGTSYTVNVIAVGTNGLDSSPASATATTPTGLPGAVTGVTMSGATSRRLSWIAAPGADGYIIDPGTGLAPITVMAPANSVSWRVGYAGDFFTATITPFNSYGNGPTASWDYAVPCAPPGKMCP
jgi:Fibronectin type III domain